MRVGPSGKRFDEQWRELNDDTPVEIPVKMREPRSMQEMVAMYVANAMALERKMASDEESVDHAEDLSVEDEDGDGEVLTPYELHAMAAEVEAFNRRKQWMAQNLGPKKPPAKPAEKTSTSEPSPADQRQSASGDKPVGSPPLQSSAQAGAQGGNPSGLPQAQPVHGPHGR